jgi:hypothetical protein
MGHGILLSVKGARHVAGAHQEGDFQGADTRRMAGVRHGCCRLRKSLRPIGGRCLPE